MYSFRRLTACRCYPRFLSHRELPKKRQFESFPLRQINKQLRASLHGGRSSNDAFAILCKFHSQKFSNQIKTLRMWLNDWLRRHTACGLNLSSIPTCSSHFPTVIHAVVGGRVGESARIMPPNLAPSNSQRSCVDSTVCFYFFLFLSRSVFARALMLSVGRLVVDFDSNRLALFAKP